MNLCLNISEEQKIIVKICILFIVFQLIIMNYLPFNTITISKDQM